MYIGMPLIVGPRRLREHDDDDDDCWCYCQADLNTASLEDPSAFYGVTYQYVKMIILSSNMSSVLSCMLLRRWSKQLVRFTILSLSCRMTFSRISL